MKAIKVVPLLLFVVGAYFLFFYDKADASPKGSNGVAYKAAEGPIFGTMYHVKYRTSDNRDLKVDIEAALREVDHSLSMFNPKSLLRAVNDNTSDTIDANISAVLVCAAGVYEATEHAFDVTVAPLVNLWGFGIDDVQQVTDEQVDAIMPCVGMDKIVVDGHRVSKSVPCVSIDASAIAKGYATDKVADVLRANGCTDYIVEIGGEIVAHGINDKGEAWRVGISTPNDDPTSTSTDIQHIVALSDGALATSGNYRRFREQDGKRTHHTIDPRTGYPAQSDVLSATVIAPNCMTADAYATAFMVLGKDKALAICRQNPDIKCLLILKSGDDFAIVKSDNFE